MKYIKEFESKTELKVGDYIIGYFNFQKFPVWAELISNSVGKVIKLGEKTHREEFTIPGIHAKYILDDNMYRILSDKDLVKIDKNNNRYIIMKLDKEDVVAFSKYKRDMIAMLNAKKYNL